MQNKKKRIALIYYLQITRLKVNTVLDREPKNYSNAKLLQFFHVFVNLIQFLTESKITICMKSIYFYLHRKIYCA